MANPVAWSFTTKAVASTGQAPVNLGTAGNFVILAKSGVSTVPNSVVTGDIGVSPITGTAIHLDLQKQWMTEDIFDIR